MTRLHPIPIAVLLRHLRLEPEHSGALFGLPRKRWYRPPGDVDLGVHHHGQRLANPLGVAAGPHTQMAQNIALGWLGGARSFELKTVQQREDIAVARPSIHAPREAYNVEWSQELTLAKSLREYVKAAWLVAILARADERERAVFEASVGYDLAGLRSAAMGTFLRELRAPAPILAELAAGLPRELAEYREQAPTGAIVESATLSTFHGAPPAEIESMARYLLEEHGLHTTLKLNPTLLGIETVRELLHEQLGYRHLELDPGVFDADLDYAEVLPLLGRLAARAAELGRGFGIKLTNTLVVGRDRELFPTHPGPHMYLSGPPLHALALALLERLRSDLGAGFPIAFSAGIDRRNFVAAVRRGLCPVTVCTDLLKPRGYGRLPAYLDALAADARAGGQGGVVEPGAGSGKRYRYRRGALALAEALESLPRYDCRDCRKCLGVCPNAAIFAWEAGRQIGIYADACNECGNCALHCSMQGAPFLVKERFYSSRATWEADADRDGMVLVDGELLVRSADEEDAAARGERVWRGVYNAAELNPVNALHGLGGGAPP